MMALDKVLNTLILIFPQIFHRDIVLYATFKMGVKEICIPSLICNLTSFLILKPFLMVSKVWSKS